MTDRMDIYAKSLRDFIDEDEVYETLERAVSERLARPIELRLGAEGLRIALLMLRNLGIDSLETFREQLDQVAVDELATLVETRWPSGTWLRHGLLVIDLCLLLATRLKSEHDLIGFLRDHTIGEPEKRADLAHRLRQAIGDAPRPTAV